MKAQKVKPLTARVLASGVTEILLYDVIGGDPWFGGGVSSEDFRREVKAAGKGGRINLRINSPGGSVTEATAMLSTLDEFRSGKGRLEVDIDGLAASAATVIATAGDVVRIARDALFMIHNPHVIMAGEANDLRREAELLDKVREQMIDRYEAQAQGKASREQIAAWMDNETWFTGQEAVEAGLADEATGSLKMAACVSAEAVLRQLGCKKIPDLGMAAAWEETNKRKALIARLTGRT